MHDPNEQPITTIIVRDENGYKFDAVDIAFLEVNNDEPYVITITDDGLPF